MADEYFFDTAEAALRRFPDELWVAKGKPKLWVKIYEAQGITVWRDLAYGLLRLRTKEGTSVGKMQVSVGKVSVLWKERGVEVYMNPAELELAPDEDTLELELEEEVEITEDGSENNDSKR